MNTDVIIVGAGPTGLSLAVQLQRYGIDFIIIDKKPETTELSKAVVVQARTLEIFSEIGLDKRAVEEGQTAMAFNLYHNGKKRARLNLSGLGKGQSKFPFVLSLEQSKTEKLLAGYLTANASENPIRWNCEFTGFSQSADGVTATYKSPDGEKTVDAKFIVGCDGASSPVRHGAGLAFVGDTIPKIFYVADTILKSPAIKTDELSVFLIDKGFILFFPMEGDGHYRIIGVLPDVDEARAEKLVFEDIQSDIVKNVCIPLEFKGVNWFSHYKVHSRKAGSFRNNRCLIAGDAAHIHTPAGGQGMNTGIQDAYNLAWKLAFVISGKSDLSLLETYDLERTENAEKLLKTTDRMFDFMAGEHWYSDFFRLHLFPSIAHIISRHDTFNKFIFPLLSQTGITYPDSALTVKSKIGKVKSGDRMHYFEFAGRNIFDLLTEPNFKLLYFGKTSPIDTQSRFGIATIIIAEIPEKLFGTEREFFILLRPDNHISYIGRDFTKIEAFLNTILIPYKTAK